MDIIAARDDGPTTPPPDAMRPVRSPSAPPPGAEIPSHYPLCFGCGKDHQTGLHIRMAAAGELSVEARFTVGEHHQGAPGLAHGGVLAVALDEVMGASNWLLMAPAVTARLEVDFRAPVPVDQTVHLTATIVAQSGRKVFTEAEARSGSVEVLHARGLFLQVPPEHFRSNGRAADVEQAAATGETRRPWLELNP